MSPTLLGAAALGTPSSKANASATDLVNEPEPLVATPAPAPATPELDTNDLGLRTLVAYKGIKGGIQLVFGLILGGMLVTDNADVIEDIAAALLHHASGAWASRIAHSLVKFATPHHVVFASLALTFDGLFSWLEGWALHTRRWWAEWLVVIATGSLIPYELYELTRHLRFGRVVVLAINIVIVVYLARRALHRPKHAAA